MAATLPFREALNEGIVSGTLVDTKIILFSRRDTSGRVCGPKALYASSHVLKTVPYFNDLLFGNFSEAKLRDFDDDIGTHDTVAVDYGYHSDSDLEDCEPTSTLARGGSRAKPTHRPVGKESYYEIHNELDNKGKVVWIPDMAFATFQAFIFYLYTGQIEFAPLRARGSHRLSTAKTWISSNNKIPRPSPKSVYRLADKYDTPPLKDLALNHMRSEMKNCDIVKETFSEFTSRYAEIQMVCVPLLVSALRNDTPEKTTWTGLCEIIESHFKGDLRHAADTLLLLWKSVSQDSDTSAIVSDGTPSPTKIGDLMSWNAFQTAIVKSIREGVFFDRKYWAQNPAEGGALKAIYFSSIIAGDKLKACIVYSSGKAASTNDSVRRMEKEDTHATLPSGPHSAWRSLFFYKCTGHISFTPIGSQSADSRLGYISEKATTDAPPPCSPKIIYTLASLLNIKELRELAFKDIERKLSAENIVEELFSPFSASDDRVLEMEWRLLFSRFKNETTMTLVQERILDISGDNSAHRAIAFKLGLRTALDLQNAPKRRYRETSLCNIVFPRARDPESAYPSH